MAASISEKLVLGDTRQRDLSVVVPSHDRAPRLRVLLDALACQTGPQETWDVFVVHDSDDHTERLLQTHELALHGRLRHRRLPEGTGSPARQRNIGWRNSAGISVAFTDDDCRPDHGWIQRLLDVAREHPEAIVQGTTRPDPDEEYVFAESRYVRSLAVDPPNGNAQTCNILYPRAALVALDGFDEGLPTPAGEDTDLAARAIERGYGLAAAPAAIVYHAVEPYTFVGMLRLSWKWRYLPCVARRHPQLRREGHVDKLFWRDSHKYLLLALVGLVGTAKTRRAALLVMPYVNAKVSEGGRRPRALVKGLRALPGAASIDLVEMIGLAVGSVRYRTIFL